MRNLSTLHVRSAFVDQDIQKFFSCDAERIYIITQDNILSVWNLNSNEEEESIPLESDELFESGSEVTGCQFIPDLEATCICTKQGDILLYENSTAEVVGSFDSGIVSMAWSPDYELVIFATQSGTLIEMTKDWDIVTEVSISEDQTKSEEFHASLSWRGDGKVFACLAGIADQPAKLHVFDRACVRESSSEEGVKIEGRNLAWRPSGSVITCTQRLPQRYDTIFFERNGLRHGEFTFRQDCSAKHLEWNSSSDLLAILVHNKSPDAKDSTAVQIWHMNNWHWYLKQEFLFGEVDSGEEVLGFHWDEEDPMKLIAICSAGEIKEFLFHWDTNVSQGLDANNQSSVAVIDGKDLLITPLRRLVPPPPMAATTLSTQVSVRQVFFAPKTYEMFVFHSNSSLECFRTMQLPVFTPAIKKPGVKGFTGQGEPPVFDQQPELIGELKIETSTPASDLSNLYQWNCLNSHTLLAIACDTDDVESSQAVFSLIVWEFSFADLSLCEIARIPIPGVPLRLYCNPDTGSTFLSLSNNEILRFSLPDELTNYTTLPTACSTIASVCFGPKQKENDKFESLDDLDLDAADDDDGGNEEILIALNNRSRLYINGEEVSRECNSFAIHDRYILFSTLTHKLRFIDHSLVYSREILETTPQHTYDVCNREVERGSRIVAVIPYNTKVVLQMPRGNLETIYPRALLLSYCRSLLNHKDYRTAFLQMRHHRIDLNLLFDHSPNQFLDNVEKFVNDLDSPTFLNLFLSSLIEEDVCVTLFPQRDATAAAITLPSYLERSNIREGKVNRICSAVRSVLEEIAPNRYLLSILTTLVKSNPPRFGEALEIIRSLRNNERAGEEHSGGEPEKKTITSESALDYMVFLVDVNELYNVALSLYDFELTIMVASKSQKDPKEYLPFLKDLHELSPMAYQKYAIDMHLQNWEKALKNISQLEEEEHYQRALALISSQNLFSLGIRLYSTNKERCTEIQKLYAKFLFENSEYEESALLYQQCKQYELALDAYMQTSNWQMVFALAEQLKYKEDEIIDLATKLSLSYRNMGQFDAAASILLEYANDPIQAIHCYTQGCFWTNAIRLCHKNRLQHLIDEVIEPAVRESFGIYSEMIESKTEAFAKQFERLKLVKRSKLLMPQMASLPCDPNLGDVFSETSSFASSRSSFSYVSMSEGGTKKRKRKKKKRISGKEGSLYEEEYLVEALKKLIPLQFEQNEVNKLLKVLLLLGYTDDAKELQNAYEKLNDLVATSLDVLIAPLIPMPGHEEELAEDEQMREKIEIKEKLDRLYKGSPWKLSCLS